MGKKQTQSCQKIRPYQDCQIQLAAGCQCGRSIIVTSVWFEASCFASPLRQHMKALCNKEEKSQRVMPAGKVTKQGD